MPEKYILTAESPAHDPYCNTIARQVYQCQHDKTHLRATNRSLQRRCQQQWANRMHGGVLRFPQSMHVLQQSLGIQSAQQHCYHWCPVCAYAWTKYVHPDDYDSIARDRCPKCNAARMCKKRGKWKPRRRYWYRGLQAIIESVLSDVDVAKEIGRRRDWDPKSGQFWGSPYAKLLDRLCGGKLSNPGNGIMSLLLALGARPKTCGCVHCRAHPGTYDA